MIIRTFSLLRLLYGLKIKTSLVLGQYTYSYTIMYNFYHSMQIKKESNFNSVGNVKSWLKSVSKFKNKSEKGNIYNYSD